MIVLGVVGAGVLVAVAAPTVATAITMRAALLIPSRRAVWDALGAQAVADGYDPSWYRAIAWQESRFRLGAVNDAGADAARGGSYGPTQISAQTVQSYGYEGDPAALAQDASLAAEWTGTIASAGKPASIESLASWWNSGHRDPASAPDVTRTVYVPAVAKAAQAASTI